MRAARDPTGDGKLAVLGLGLIGGSVLRGAVAQGLAGEISGWDVSPAILDQVREAGLERHIAPTLEEACEGALTCVVAVPVRSVPALVDRARRLMPPDAVVTDTGSTKGWIAAEVERLGQTTPRPRTLAAFIGGHPVAGSEKDGFTASRADLFRDQPWLLTSAGAGAPAEARARRLVLGLGARPVLVSAEEHDRVLALTSHLPYVLAVALTEVAQETGGATATALAPFVAGGFRDATRLALQDPSMSLDMTATNATELGKVLAKVASAAAGLVSDGVGPRLGRARAFRADLGRFKRWT